METVQREENLQVQKPSPRKWRFPALKKGKKRWKRLILLLCALGAAYWFFVLRPGGQAGGAGMGPAYQVQAVQRRDLSVSVSGTGTLAPAASYQVKALVSGEILEAPFQVGDRIEKGDLLYRIDAKDAEAAVQQAELTVRQAQLSRDELEENLRLTASASGVVQKVYVQKGDLLSPGSPVADILDTSTLYLTVPFQSAGAAELAPGQSAQVTLAGTMEALPAVVESVSSAELVGAGGALVRQVRLRLSNPGALTEGTSATASAGELACAGSGTLEAASRQTVTARASGEVTAVYAAAGSGVSAGSVLAELGGAQTRSALENADIALESAQLSLQRAQDALENYIVTSPISGTVIEKTFKEGDKIDSMDSGSLAVLFDLSAMELKLNVNELDIGKIREGQTVEIAADAVPGQTFRGTVERLSVNGTTANGFTTYPVTVRLEDYGELNPGMNVTTGIIVEEMKNVLSVPASAVQRGDTVLIPGEGALAGDGTTLADPSRTEERAVTLGGGDGEYVEIVSGLGEGDLVLVPAQDGAAAPVGG